MDCKNCQYHTKDGRCLYFCGCVYKLMEFEAEALGYRKIGDPADKEEQE